jgi:hypothetical protein
MPFLGPGEELLVDMWIMKPAAQVADWYRARGVRKLELFGIMFLNMRGKLRMLLWVGRKAPRHQVLRLGLDLPEDERRRGVQRLQCIHSRAVVKLIQETS